MATVEEKAAALALKAEHYSNAFRLAAEIVERRKRSQVCTPRKTEPYFSPQTI